LVALALTDALVLAADTGTAKTAAKSNVTNGQ
jgi:hypothetical protein